MGTAIAYSNGTLEDWIEWTITEMRPLCNEYWNRLKIYDIPIRDLIIGHNIEYELMRSYGYIVGSNINMIDDILDRKLTDMDVFPYRRIYNMKYIYKCIQDDSPMQYYRLVVSGMIPYMESGYKDNAIKTYTPLYRSNISCNILNKMELENTDIPNTGDLYICSPMGTCKTESTYHTLTSSYIMIGCRVLQNKKYSVQLPDATLYGTHKDWKYADKLIVELESLHHVSKFNYDILYIDEVETVLRLFISDTLSMKELQTFNVLCKLLRCCKRIIVMDAFLKEETINAFLAKRIGKEYKIICNHFKSIERTGNYTARIYSKKNEWIAKVCDDDRKKVIISLNKRVARDLAMKLNNKGEKTLLIIKETPDSIKSLDPNTNWIHYHNVIYTPTICNSISFSKQHFDTKYGYYCRKSATHEDFIQMLGRVRHTTENIAHLYVDRTYIPMKNVSDEVLEEGISLDKLGQCKTFNPLDRDIMREWMMYESEIFNHMPSKPFLAEVWDTLDTWIQDIYIRLYTDRSLDQIYMYQLLTHQMENTLFWNIEYDYRYTRTEKLDKAIDVINMNDLDVFHTYISSKYVKSNDIYTRYWCKMDQITIKNLVCAYRGYDKVGDILYTDKAIQIRNDIVSLFDIGGISFDDALQKRDKIVLHYSGKDREKVHDIGSRLISWYPNLVVEREIWKWLGKVFYTKLLLDGKILTGKHDGYTRHYYYELDMSDWIWYHIIK